MGYPPLVPRSIKIIDLAGFSRQDLERKGVRGKILEINELPPISSLYPVGAVCKILILKEIRLKSSKQESYSMSVPGFLSFPEIGGLGRLAGYLVKDRL
jgi:hypothetical protein